METVGDKYMAVSGLPEACENHAKWIAKLSLDMMDMAKNVKMGSEPVVRINCDLIWRWVLFGDEMKMDYMLCTLDRMKINRTASSIESMEYMKHIWLAAFHPIRSDTKYYKI